jgi:uncharacterized membrane protein YdjX (TVP38/TMEM64 family)
MSSPRTAIVHRYAATVKWTSLLLAVFGLVLIGQRFPLGTLLAALEAWLGALGPSGPVVFGLIYAVAVVLLLPSWLLTMAAGALFGLVVGTVVVSLASTTGAAMAFLIARWLARGRIQRRLGCSPRLLAIDHAISAGGWRIVALLRLSPAVPFTLQNYFYGLTGLGFGPCILTSWLAMLPGSFLYVYLGHVGRVGLEAAVGEERHRSPAEWALLVVGLLATLTAILYVSRLAWRVLRQRTPLSEPALLQTDIEDEMRATAWPWAATACAGLALASLTLAGWAWLDPESFQHRASVLLGFPYSPRPVAEP